MPGEGVDFERNLPILLFLTRKERNARVYFLLSFRILSAWNVPIFDNSEVCNFPFQRAKDGILNGLVVGWIFDFLSFPLLLSWLLPRSLEIRTVIFNVGLNVTRNSAFDRFYSFSNTTP